jgi:uncharacterized protein (DUF1778 family)
MRTKPTKIEVLLTPEEKAAIRQAAEDRRLSMSALLRISALQLATNQVVLR